MLTPLAYDRVDWELGEHNWMYGRVSVDAEQSEGGGTCGEDDSEYDGLFMVRCQRCDPRTLEYTRAVHFRI